MNQSVLVIDDQSDSLTTIQSVFDQVNIAYEIDSDSDSVCQSLATESTTTSIILRFSSQQVDGLQLCGRIRSLPGCQNLHILMIVSEVSHDQTTRALAAGANDIITEPLCRAELVNRCGVVQRRKMRRIEAAPEDVLANSHVVLESPVSESPVSESPVVEDLKSVQPDERQPQVSRPGYQIHAAENRGFVLESGRTATADDHVEETDSTNEKSATIEANVAEVETRIDAVQSRIVHQPQIQPTVIQPVFDAATQRYVYPTDAASIDAWNDDPEVVKIQLDTVLTCPDCNAVPGFRFGCSDCGSGCTERVTLIHHFACACVADEREFRNGRDFVCPKCRIDGLVGGTDFESTPGGFSCSDCFAKVDQPELIGHCSQCSLRFPAHRATIMQLTAYRLPVTQADEQSRQNHRPRFTSVRKTKGRTIHRSEM